MTVAVLDTIWCMHSIVLWVIGSEICILIMAHPLGVTKLPVPCGLLEMLFRVMATVVVVAVVYQVISRRFKRRASQESAGGP